MPEPPGLAGLLVGFARELREAGLAVGSGEIGTCCQALTWLDPSDLVDVYWAGRATLVARRSQIGTYDEVFRRFFLGEGAPEARAPAIRPRAAAESKAALLLPLTDPHQAGRQERQDQAELGLMASDAEALWHKSFAACTDAERAAMRRIMARMRLTPPRRRARRTRPAPSGRSPDLRRTVRASLRMGGDPARLYWRQRKLRPRPLVLILDISGSMADYSRHLLQFAHTASRASARVEVFCFGTRLTRITPALAHRSPDRALADAALAVWDWEGGTRIGGCLEAFVRDFGRRGLARGAVVVICSDGLDRGDPEVLESALERLTRLCRRLVWVNPHVTPGPGFRPGSLGMAIAAEHADEIVSGRDLASLERLAALLPTLA